jgi:hypothetical protein
MQLDPIARAALRGVLREIDGVEPELLESLAFGGEDQWAPTDAAGGTGTPLAVLFALTATPEREHHGALLQRLRARHSLVLIDESAFRARFAGDERRLDERRNAWRTLLREHGIEARFVDLGTADVA